MPGSSSPQKRKFNEYHDPDYPVEDERLLSAAGSDSKRHRDGAEQLTDTSSSRLSEIITREFDCEIAFKQQQLEQIYERLGKARLLLDRLRYAIVADYYRKQELQLSQSAVASVRDCNSLLTDEQAGPQLALHPSLKKIIGKKPRSYEELLRAHPKRAAAQNAKSTIVKSKVERREERRLQQLIRKAGIVIDHSKEDVGNNQTVVGEAERISVSKSPSLREATASGEKSYTNRLQSLPSVTQLNAPRLNNKTKHLVVVGNTSKYIAPESGFHQDQNSSSQILTHKWLVYVQAKDTGTPVESFLKKVRFFLHSSYKPNDVVDICSPPFQIARRGWGEFPVRLQLFFHENLQQKPVQLVHNLLLDKTLSGFHTLGAETLVEIWLRTAKPVEKTVSAPKLSEQIEAKPETTPTVKPQHTPKARTISYTQNKEELEDNLFEFLSKIEATPTSICADIEKLQPTVMVTESLENITNSRVKLELCSPKKADPSLKVPLHNQEVKELPTTPVSEKPILGKALPMQTVTQPITANGSGAPEHTLLTPAVENSVNTIVNPLKPNLITVQNSNLANLVLGSEPKNRKMQIMNILRKGVKISQPSPIRFVKSNLPSNPAVAAKACAQGAPQTILQKKLVQLVDAEGKVKYIQMLVATNATTGPTFNGANIVAKTSVDQPNAAPISVPVRSESSKAKCGVGAVPVNVGKANNAPKNVVFQKEGKLFIIDPLQIKLKQQQKKQVSLLKPQISLLKQDQHQKLKTIAARSVACDHDYGVSTNTKTLNHQVLSTQNKPVVHTAPPVHMGIRQTRTHVSNSFEQLQVQRAQIQQHFLDINFASMRSAVEYLLRRIPLIAPKKSPAAAFPFVRNSEKEFQALPAFKQRACEWLRSKYIARNTRNHKDLQHLVAVTTESFWSTREITVFARYHAYTPLIKALLQPNSETNMQHFTELVKSELKNEQQPHYDTLTTHTLISTWVNNTWQKLEKFENVISDNQIIDVDSIPNDEEPRATAKNKFMSPLKHNNDAQMSYLRIPEKLTHETQLVGDICKDFGIRLQSEEIYNGVWHPLAQTVLAQSLHIFVEKLLRLAVAAKLQQSQSSPADTIHSGIGAGLTIGARDIGTVVTQNTEFDFLTNRNFGITRFNENEPKCD